MQGPNAVLNVITLPPGATQTQPRLVIDGVRGAIFLYATGGPSGALVGSWAIAAGTDPYGNSYPSGFDVTNGVIQNTSGNFTVLIANGQIELNFILGVFGILNSNGIFFYSGSGAATGTLQASMASAAGTDPYNNSYNIGLQGQAFTFVRVGSNPPAGVAGPTMYADNTGTAIGITTSSNMQPQIVAGATNTTQFTVTQTVPTVITHSYTVKALDAQPGTVYLIKAWGNGTQGSTQQSLQFYLSAFGVNNQAKIAFTSLVVGASTAFSWKCEGIVSVDPVGNTATFHLEATISVFGNTITNSNTLTALGNNSAVPITIGSDENMLIAAAWFANAGAPTVTSLGSFFDRRGA